MPTREQVWGALFTKLKAAADFSTTSRRLQLMPDNSPMVPINQPALYLLEGNETTEQRGRGTPSRRTWRASIWVFAKIPDGLRVGTPDDSTPGAAVLNPLLDAIENVFASDDVGINVMTLGGLVSHCYIEGETQKVVGDLNADGQCWASIPVAILVP